MSMPEHLERTLHKLWSSSQYHGVFTKKWWRAQQTVAVAYDRGRLSMRSEEVEALIDSWRFAAGCAVQINSAGIELPARVGKVEL